MKTLHDLQTVPFLTLIPAGGDMKTSSSRSAMETLSKHPTVEGANNVARVVGNPGNLSPDQVNF
jgi:hypothetical protein